MYWLYFFRLFYLQGTHTTGYILVILLLLGNRYAILLRLGTQHILLILLKPDL
uniref:Uncharacterized protein n=1 Tax=Anguilla anguilla TaxID=7936 RepID=A0A0E9WNK8_ANGAN